MLPLTLFYIVGLLVVGGTAIYYSSKEERLRKILVDREKLQQQRIYEITIMKSVQDRIGYSMDVERIVTTLTQGLKTILPYTSVSSLFIRPETLTFEVSLEEKVSNRYITQIKNIMLNALIHLIEIPLPKDIQEIQKGVIVEEGQEARIGSYFNVPFILNGVTVALITVTSTKKNAYSDTEMTMFYEIVNQAAFTLSRISDLITNEQDKLIAMIKGMSDGIVIIDTNNEVTVINESAIRLLKLQTTTPTIFDLLSSIPQTFNLTQQIEEAIETRKTIEDKELLIGDNTVQLLITPVFGNTTTIKEFQEKPMKKVLGVTIVLHDITLERSLAQMKETFTHSVIHELRSPLTAIKAAAEMLTFTNKLAPDQQKMIDIITQQTKRMIGDIGSLLDVAKMESGQFSIKQVPTEIKTVFDDTINLFSSQATLKHINLISHVPTTIPLGFIDPVRIEQVLNNLVSNSLKFTPENGTISLTASLEWNDTKAKSAMNPHIKIVVSDNGNGIPKDKQHLLFLKYSQAITTPVPGQQGTGLGLFISKAIVEAHGGVINLLSEQHKGTSIFFTLPLVALKTNTSEPSEKN